MGFTLRSARAHEWVEVARWTRPADTIIVYRAGPGYLARRKCPGSDLLEVRPCETRVEVCRVLFFKMQAAFFAKLVFSFLGKVA